MNSKVMKAAFNYFDRDRDGHISLQLPQGGLSGVAGAARLTLFDPERNMHDVDFR